VALLFVVVAVWGGRHFLADQDGLQIHTVSLGRGPLHLTVSTTGRLAPTNQVTVGSEVSGTVEQVLVTYNDRVSRGQTIATLKPEYYQAQHEQAQAEHAKALAQVLQLEVNEREALREFQRIEKLRGSGAASEEEYFVRKAAYDVARATTEVARAAIPAAESQVHLTAYTLKRAVIASPIDGIVLDRRVDVGQTVAATLQTPVMFVLAEDLAQMDLLADVSESDIGYVATGQPVTFTVNAFRNRTFQGYVRQIRNEPHTVGDVVNYTVVISVRNDQYLFRPGMPADVDIQIVQQDDTTKVTNAALRFRPPLPPDVVRRQIDQLVWPTPPASIRVLGTRPATTQPDSVAVLPPPIEPAKGTLWQYEHGQWKPVPVWTLYTDNRETAVVTAPGLDDAAAFATEIGKADPNKNMLKQAMMLANPENRRL
jgi:HlyD family secretion protein